MGAMLQFSKDDTTFYKGLGILMIVIHNYCHWTPGFGLENEESFNKEHVYTFISYLQTFNFKTIFAAVFAFLGHYGVQIFIFFSAYGLTIQYQGKKSSDLKFLLTKLKKIYFLLGFAIMVAVSFNFVLGNMINPKSVLWETFLLASTVSSFSNIYLYKLFSGPYWFFALIIQLYVLYPIFYKLFLKFTRENIWLLFIILYILIYPLHYYTAQNHFTLFGNIIGHLPEVFLGIALARYRDINCGFVGVLVASLVFVGSQFYEVLFPLSFLSVTIILLYLFRYIQGLTNEYFRGTILFTGQISMILFVVNGPLRGVSLYNISDQALRTERVLWFLVILYFVSYILFNVYRKICSKLKI